MQMFRSLKKDAETCKFCEQNADSFKGYKHLNSVDKQDFSEIQCKNCTYISNYLCAVENNE